jgi:hypothetical protein
MFFKIVPILIKKNLREIYEDTQKLEQGVLGTPKIWDRVSPGNFARVSNLWHDLGRELYYFKTQE